MDKKLYREKEMHLYFFDNEGYYTSVTRKYLTIVFNTLNIEEDEVLINFGLNLSIETKSVFILPKFKCSQCSGKCRYCGSHIDCSFIEFWKIRDFNKVYDSKYRESVLYIFLIFINSHFYLIH